MDYQIVVEHLVHALLEDLAAEVEAVRAVAPERSEYIGEAGAGPRIDFERGLAANAKG